MIEKVSCVWDVRLPDVQAAIENTETLNCKTGNGLSIMATISSGAPMLGFPGYGNWYGSKLFWNMANAGNNIDITLLSSGIYEG